MPFPMMPGSPDKKKASVLLPGGSVGASAGTAVPGQTTQATGSGAIFEFFKKLTSGELKVDSEDKIIPFSIFISTYRRKKILAAMMGKTNKEKEEGTRILNNYKKQLAEKLAREKAERGETLSTTTYSHKKSVSSHKGKHSDKRSRSNKSSRRQHPELSNVDSMEPEILLRILFGKGGLGTQGGLITKK